MQNDGRWKEKGERREDGPDIKRGPEVPPPHADNLQAASLHEPHDVPIPLAPPLLQMLLPPIIEQPVQPIVRALPVLQQENLSVLLAHSSHLPQRLLRSLVRAQRERRHDGVESAVREHAEVGSVGGGEDEVGLGRRKGVGLEGGLLEHLG